MMYMIINFSTKQIDNPKDWWFQVVYHGMPSQSTFLQMIKDWKFKNIEKAFRKRTLPDTESIMKRNDCISIHVYAPSHHSNLVQEFLAEKLDKRFVEHTEWFPASSDCNPLIATFGIMERSNFMEIER